MMVGLTFAFQLTGHRPRWRSGSPVDQGKFIGIGGNRSAPPRKGSINGFNNRLKFATATGRLRLRRRHSNY